MKKLLLFAIMALSINAFAQNKTTDFYFQHHYSISTEYLLGKIHRTECKTSNSHSEMNPGQDIKHQTPQLPSLIQIYDSIYDWQWDNLNLEWKIKSRSINIIYDANNNLTEGIWQDWGGNTWQNSSKYTNTYDVNNNLTSELYQGWNGSDWVDLYKFTYTYDANNNVTSNKYEISNGMALENFRQYTYTYDVNNNRTSGLMQMWNGSTWVNSSLYTYTYDANNYPTVYLLQNWNGNSWENYFQSIYSYDANNILTSLLRQSWNVYIWEDLYLSTFTYDANNNQIKEFIQDWNGNIWKNFWQDTTIYDANNNPINYLSQYWISNSWVNSYQIAFTYDANNFTQSEVLKWWNESGTSIESGDSTYYYFHTVLGLNDWTVQEGNITVYPNPTNGKFTISSNSTISSIEIYNLLGELIRSNFTFNQQTSTEIDLSKESKGLYFAKMKVGTKVYARKIIVQ